MAWLDRTSDDRAPWRWASATLVVLGLAVALSFTGLGDTKLVKMEGMVADVAQAMRDSGDWLVPRLYGEIFTYKPPLLYWMVAVSFELTGTTSEWALRLPAALAASLLGLALLFFVGRVAGPRTGALAAVASFTSGLFLQKLQLAEYDGLLAAFVGIAVAAAAFAFAGERRQGSTGVWGICYLALAAGFLMKGMPALMVFGPGILLAALATGRLRALLRRPHLAGVALFVLIAGGYLWAAQAAAGWQVFDQPLAEARDRGIEWTLANFGRTLLKPAIIAVLLLPWSLLLPWGWSREATSPTGRLARAGWGFLVGGTLSFMIVPTHESRYYLPLAAPCAIVAALAFERAAASQRRWASRLALALAALVGLATLVRGLDFDFPVAFPAARPLLAVLGAAGLLVPLATRSRWSRRRNLAAALLLVVFCTWSLEIWSLRHRRAHGRDLSATAAVLESDIPAGATVWTLGPAADAGMYSSLLYYLDRPIRSFYVGEPLPPGAFCLVTSLDLPRLEPLPPSALRQLRRVETRHWTFYLFRLEGETGSDASTAVNAPSPDLLTGLRVMPGDA